MPKPNKPNPILAALEAKLRREFAEEKAQMEANHKQRVYQNSEINLIATLIAGSNLGIIGHKRSGELIREQIKVKQQIAKDIATEEDPEMIYTKYDIATRLKQILGPDNWKKYRELFPLLREYWD